MEADTRDESICSTNEMGHRRHALNLAQWVPVTKARCERYKDDPWRTTPFSLVESPSFSFFLSIYTHYTTCHHRRYHHHHHLLQTIWYPLNSNNSNNRKNSVHYIALSRNVGENGSMTRYNSLKRWSRHVILIQKRIPSLDPHFINLFINWPSCKLPLNTSKKCIKSYSTLLLLLHHHRPTQQQQRRPIIIITITISLTTQR